MDYNLAIINAYCGLTCSFFVADPSLLKYSSFAAALIWEVCGALRRGRLRLMPNELEDIEAKDDSLLLPEEANDPTAVTPAKVEAICCIKVSNQVA
ncbi:hypothetical protein Hanom_Chr15g01399491 [Helianthus anomalus]